MVSKAASPRKDFGSVRGCFWKKSIKTGSKGRVKSGMAVITLNVIGDAATNVIVNFKEGVLDKDTYNK